MIRLLRKLSLQREQIDSLHEAVRALKARIAYLEEQRDHLDHENVQLRQDLLDHHFICCTKGEMAS